MRSEVPNGGQLTSESYWSGLWLEGDVHGPIDPTDGSIRNHANLARHRVLKQALAGVDEGARLMEVGAAGSRWLPYFHHEFGFEVTGLDYSEAGCEKAQSIMDAAGVPGSVICADLFDPPHELDGQFDVVVSFGVVEHFEDTALCLSSCARFLKEGGRMVTTVPNMLGSLGFLQRVFDRDIYDFHVPLSPDTLAAAHRQAGLEVVDCNYFLGANWSSVACGRPAAYLGYARRAVSVATKLVWMLERAGFGPTPNIYTSPYIFCSAVKRNAEGSAAVSRCAGHEFDTG